MAAAGSQLCSKLAFALVKLRDDRYRSEVFELILRCERYHGTLALPRRELNI